MTVAPRARPRLPLTRPTEFAWVAPLTSPRAALGFRDGDKGVHSSRTMMLDELTALLDHATPASGMDDFRRLAVADNVLDKPTRTTREHTVRKLKALYGLDPALPLFRALAYLWPLDLPSRPLLALLVAVARDPLLRLALPSVLEVPLGAPVHPDLVRASLTRVTNGRFSDTNLTAIASRVLSTLTQSGHLTGKTDKHRSAPLATPTNAALALFIAYLEGRRAQSILGSSWTKLLGVSPTTLLELARIASRRGLIHMKQAGDVLELRFPDWLTRAEDDATREKPH